jgi:dTMP kinase
MLFDWLRSNYREKLVEYLSFPDYTTAIGGEIRAFLSGKKDYSKETRHILYAANRYEHKERIERLLNSAEKRILVVNRYCDSNVAYGAANGLSLQWLKEIESQMPKADLIFLLRATPEVSIARKATGRDIYEADRTFLARVAEVYDALAEEGKWFVINGERPVEIVHYEIRRLVQEVVLG